MRAGACHIAVSEKLPGFLVIELHGCFLDEFTLFIKAAEEIRCGLAVGFGGGPAVYVKRYAETFERILDDAVIPVDYILWRNTLFFSFDGDRHSMLVAAADKEHFFSFETQVTRIDVGGNIYTGKMSDMNRTVGIGESCRY